MAKRSSELALDENSIFQTKCMQERKKVESEIDLVKRKLKEERTAKLDIIARAAEDENKARWPCIHSYHHSCEYQACVN